VKDKPFTLGFAPWQARFPNKERKLGTMKKRIITLLLALMLVVAMVPMASAASAASAKPWDGTTIDVSWYSKTKTEFYISTPEQFMGLAAIVNGIYNAEITTIIGDASVIVANKAGEVEDSGSQNKSTNVYYFGADDFNGKTVYLTADLDMGGTYNAATETWSGPNYMPIGGQYLMASEDTATKLGSSFCGTLDGQGHYIRNIYCSRRSAMNYGDGQSVGLIGRLGVHDNDPLNMRPTGAAVRNLAVTGYIYANRSVGGIVGKIGKTNGGAVIENCANFATVANTDAKGCGGIVGASWNGGVIRNCYNAGNISSTYVCPTGGIAGSNEIAIENCYNVGKISAVQDSYAMAIGTNNGGGTDVKNCYWLTNSAPGGGYYSRVEVDVTELKASEMKSESFIAKLGGAFIADANGINGGYPILAWQADVMPVAEPSAPLFTDVPASAWFADAVSFVVDAGLFFGTSDTTFSPDSTMNRAMFVTVLARLDGANIDGYTDGSFSDVSASAWYAKSVNWAAATGLVNGTGDGKFSPDASISLEAMVLVLYRYSGESATGDAMPSNVGEVSSWAREAMVWAQSRQLLDGIGGALNAQGAATRAQVAAMLRNFAQ